MEISTLQYDVFRCLIGSATLPAENTGYAHRFFRIADSEVMLPERMFFSVQGDEFLAFVPVLDDDVLPLDHVRIKAVHRLAVGHHDVIGNIDNVVDRAQTDDIQLVLQPLRTFLHLAAGYAQTGITPAGIRILDGHIDRKVVVVNPESTAVRTMKRCLVTILRQPGIEVTGHTVMAQRIGTVGRNVYVDQPVAVQMIILGGRLSDRCILRQYDNAVMACADTDFILSTDHTEALHTTQLALLDGEFLVVVIEHAAQISHNDFLSCSHIRCATHNLLRFALSEVDGCHVEMVRVGVRLTGQHFADEEPFQSSPYCFHLVQCIHLKSRGGQRIRCLLRGQVKIDVFLKPFV